MNKEILSVVELFSYEKSLPREKIFEALEQALSEATQIMYANKINIRVHIDRKTGHFNTFRRWIVVNQLSECNKEITFETVFFENPNIKVYDFIENKIESITLNRINKNIVKKIVMNKVREVEQSVIFDKFYNKKGEMISGIVKKHTRDYIYLKICFNVEAIISYHNILPREHFRIGDRIRGILYDIRIKAKRIQLFISRVTVDMLKKLFYIEVPEIRKKIIEIKNIARDPGSRTKIVVYSHNKKIDAIGSCIGIRGSRIQAISSELNGEKIDVILWSPNLNQLIINSMAPARVISTIIHKDIKSIDVAVKNSNLAQAIGKNGQNVRLASRISGWEINVMNIDDLYNNNTSDIYNIRNFLIKNLNIKHNVINSLIKSGICSLEKIACIPYSELLKIKEIDSKIAHMIQNKANKILSDIMMKKQCKNKDALFLYNNIKTAY